jgi:hypothetical protein
MQKLAAIVIIIIAGMWYYRTHTDQVTEWFSKNVPKQLATLTGASDLLDIQSHIQNGLSEEFVREQLSTYVIKDGIQLPQGWKLNQKKIDGTYFTIVNPQEPKDDNDFIAVKVPVDNVAKLPDPKLCTEDPKTVTCVVGTNLDTHRAFSLMTYL